MVLEFHPPGVPIIKENDPSNRKVYIVLTGELFVVVKEPDVLFQENIGSLYLGDIPEHGPPKNSVHTPMGSNSSAKTFLLSYKMLGKGDHSLVASPKSSAKDDAFGTPRNRFEKITSNMSLTPKRMEILQKDLINSFHKDLANHDTKTKSLWNRIAPAVLIQG